MNAHAYEITLGPRAGEVIEVETARLTANSVDGVPGLLTVELALPSGEVSEFKLDHKDAQYLIAALWSAGAPLPEELEEAS